MRKLGILILACVAISVFAQPAELPAAPSGFEWRRVPEVKAAFLMPKSWHFKREKDNSTYAYFATREDIDRTGQFAVGLTVNVTPHLENRDASAYVRQFIAEFPKGKKLRKAWDASIGSFVGGGCIVEDDVAVMSVLMVANPKTNTLYFFMFEAPTAEWESQWKTGEAMLRTIYLDDEI